MFHNRAHRNRVLSAFGIFLNKPDDNGGGGGAPEKPKTLADALVALDAANAAKAKAEGGSAQLVAAEKQRAADAVAAKANLQTQFDELVKTANDEKAKVTKLEGELATERATVERQKGELQTKGERISNLEALCGVKGVDPNAAVGTVAPPVAKMTQADYERQYAAAKTPAERDAVLEAFSKANREGNLQR